MYTEKGRGDALRALEHRLSYTFRDVSLLSEALTHSSYANENGGRYNERLEFLGDAVLELATSDRLFRVCSNSDEGHLTRLRAQVVCKNSLSAWAKEMELLNLILVGNSLIKNGPTDSMAADCVEALFGAIYIDGGYDAAMAAVGKFLDTKSEITLSAVQKDPKTTLQEYLQREGKGIPTYETVQRTGPDHASKFKVCLIIDGKILAEAWGSSTKEAEFKAAEEVLRRLGRCMTK